MTTERYYLKADHQTEWNEVTREQFINAEQAAGFHSQFGPNHPATGGFRGSGMRGRIEHVTEQPRPEQEGGGPTGEHNVTEHTHIRICTRCRRAEPELNVPCVPLPLNQQIKVESDDVPTVSERGEWWMAVPDEAGNCDIHATTGKYIARARSMEYMQQIITEHNQHSTLVAQRERLIEALSMIVCNGCHNRIGWTETPTKYGDWTKCSSCRAARAALTTIEQEGTQGQ